MNREIYNGEMLFKDVYIRRGVLKVLGLIERKNGRIEKTRYNARHGHSVCVQDPRGSFKILPKEPSSS